MIYKKYVELLNLNITSEPTESPTTYSTESSTFIYYTFSPTIHPIQKQGYNRTELIIVAVFSSISGMLFIILIMLCKYKYIKTQNNQTNNKIIKKYNIEDDTQLFGTQFVLDDV